MVAGRILVATNYYFTASVSAGLNPGLLPNGRLIHVSKRLLTSITFPQPSAQGHYHSNTLLAHRSCDCHMTLIATHGHSHRYSSSAGNEHGWLRQRWIKLMTTVRAFAAGTKALYQDMKKMREIQSKHGARKMVLGHPPRDPKTGQVDFPLTREELLFTVKTKKDLLKMLPTVVLFCIPFFGYFVPLIAFMYPQQFLSSHFLTDKQKEELMMSNHKKVLAKTKVLSDLLKKEGGDEDQLSFLYEVSDMFASGQVDDDVIKLTRGSGSLRNADRKIMEAMVDVWEARSLLALVGLRSHSRILANHLRYLYTSDWLMKLEGGVHALPRQALSELCFERRLDVDFKSSEDMRQKLEVWMKISTTFEEECPELVMADLPAAQFIQKNDKH